MAVEVSERGAKWSSAHAAKMGAVARLARGLSHDVAELVEDAASSIHDALGRDDGRQQLFNAASTLQRAALIARQLEGLGAPTSGDSIVRSLDELVAEVLPLMRRLAGPGVDVCALDIDPTAWVRCGTGQLEQVLFHLVVNARDAMPGGGRITIAVRRVKLAEARSHRHGHLDSGDWVALEVADTGIGMNLDIQEQLFEPFFTTKPPGLGSGLGLATVYGIVTNLGGQVTVASADGSGSTMTAWLPAAPQPLRVTPIDEVEPALLVADDDEWVRAVTARMLRQEGHAVLEAVSGEEALELLDDVVGSRISVVIAAATMTDLSGMELMDRIGREHPGVRVVLISGRGTVEDVRGVPVFEKPFSRDELLAAIAAG